jgi:bifunctional non-homologous end joining protein LigD
VLQRARGAEFEKLRHRSNDQDVILIAFDLLELNGTDLRRQPIETQACSAAVAPAFSSTSICLTRETWSSVTPAKWALRGVSKRLASPYRSGRTRDWLKFKNPEAPA